MTTVRIEVNSHGVRELLGDAKVQRYVEELAERVARAAGQGMGVQADHGRLRARAVVITETYAAKNAEAHDRALTRAIDAGRG